MADGRSAGQDGVPRHEDANGQCRISRVVTREDAVLLGDDPLTPIVASPGRGGTYAGRWMVPRPPGSS